MFNTYQYMHIDTHLRTCPLYLRTSCKPTLSNSVDYSPMSKCFMRLIFNVLLYHLKHYAARQGAMVILSVSVTFVGSYIFKLLLVKKHIRVYLNPDLPATDIH